MSFKLSISDVQNSPEDFLYIFATDEFLSYLGSYSKKIITQKRANQLKILRLCAKNANVDEEEYYDAVRQGLFEIYGLKPGEILVKLAAGETVAGKNWSEGVYGVGAISDTFVQPNSKKFTVKVNTETGYLVVNGHELASDYIARNGCPNGYGGFSYVDDDGNTFFSSYSKTKKQYYAATYTTKDGQKYDARGNAKTSASASDIWETVLGFLDKLANWIISIFGGDTSGKTFMTAKNTGINQKDDGWCVPEEAGFGTWGVALLGAFAVGALLWGEEKKSNRKK